MADREAEVLAMLIDTDGTISVGGSGADKLPRPLLGVDMNSVLPIKIAEKWGGVIDRVPTYNRYDPQTMTLRSSTDVKNGQGLQWKYRWRLCKAEDVWFVLQKIKPYLVVKQKRAEIALKMLDIKREKKPDWKEKTRQLAEEFHVVCKEPPPDIDLTKLPGVLRAKNDDNLP